MVYKVEKADLLIRHAHDPRLASNDEATRAELQSTASEHRLARLETRLESMERRFEHVNARLDRLDDKIDARYSSLTSQLDALAKELGALFGAVYEVKRAVEAKADIHQRLGRLEDRILQPAK